MLPDRAAHDDMIGPRSNRAGGGGHAVLVIGGRTTGPHARHAAVSPFLMYEFGPAAPVVVLCETHTADLYLSADADIASYRALYDGLQDAALSPQDSRAYLADAARDLRAAD